jgi:hypothetical protein
MYRLFEEKEMLFLLKQLPVFLDVVCRFDVDIYILDFTRILQLLLLAKMKELILIVPLPSHLYFLPQEQCIHS